MMTLHIALIFHLGWFIFLPEEHLGLLVLNSLIICLKMSLLWLHFWRIFQVKNFRLAATFFQQLENNYSTVFWLLLFLLSLIAPLKVMCLFLQWGFNPRCFCFLAFYYGSFCTYAKAEQYNDSLLSMGKLVVFITWTLSVSPLFRSKSQALLSDHP